MIVVSDTSAITSLIQIERAELLADLFEQVVVPLAVERELRRRHSQLPAFVQARQVADVSGVRRLRRELDEGEAEAIVLAKETQADALLIDEKVGRAIALREGVPIIGLVGVLITARRSGAIAAMRPLLDALESKANFHISAELRADALRSVGE